MCYSDWGWMDDGRGHGDDSYYVPVEPGAPCPVECEYCTGAQCIRHGHKPCECDTIDRHRPEDRHVAPGD